MDTIFFKLPRELRDTVYEYYFYQKHGYQYHHESGKMGAKHPNSESKLHLFALMYTCRALYQETKSVALSTNVLVFRPYLSQPHVDNGKNDSQRSSS
jgi:hypothetical protein